MNNIKSICNLIGRLTLCGIFTFSIYNLLTNFKSNVEYSKSAGLTIGTEFLVVAAIILLIIGILSLFSGFKVEIGAVSLLIFIVPVTFIFHQFWRYSGQEAMMQFGQFFSDLGLIAGLLILFASGAGSLSLDYLLKKK